MGAYELARAELESLAGWGELDDESLLDLAEARWRTGDLEGAGDAARAYLATGREDVLGLVIAAEAIAAMGRPGEARRLAGQALERSEIPLDRLFAGMPRSGIWPHDPGDPGEHAGTLFGGSGGQADGAGGGATHRHTGVPTPETGLGLWEGHHHEMHPIPAVVDAPAELDAARRLLDAGDLDQATIRLAVVLRSNPALAPAVLDAIPADPSPGLQLVRGDAFRLLGHDSDAQRAYASALAAVSRDAAPSNRDDVAEDSVAGSDPS
jgi:tetratricopeptide (TPR) repeat protein